MKIQQFLVLVFVLMTTALLSMHVRKPPIMWKALKMHKLVDENFSDDLKATVLLKSSVTLTPQKPTMKKIQKSMPKKVIHQFIDTYIIPWLNKNGKIECKGVERRKMESELDKILFDVGYYSVRIQDIPSLNQETLEKLPGADITLIPNADEMSSEDVRLILVEQVKVERKRALSLKVMTIRQYTKNGITSTIGDQSSYHPDRQNAYNQNQRDDPIGMTNKTITNMKTHSNSKTRGHPFNLTEVLPNMIDAFLDIKFGDDGIGRCGCQGNHKPCHNGKVKLMANGGGYGISFDRMDDTIGYNQHLTVVCDLCNKPVKPDSVPVKRSTPVAVIQYTVKSQITNTRRRMKSLQKSPKKRREDEKRYLHRWEHDYDNGTAKSDGRKRLKEEYKATFTKKYSAVRNGDRSCPCCKLPMDVGTDEKTPKLPYTNNPRQISPDRINDSNPFYDADNYDLLCLACQPNGRVEYTAGAKQKPFTREKQDEMVQYLQERLRTLTIDGAIP